MNSSQSRRANHLLNIYDKTRQYSLALCEGLSAEDMQVQSMPDASPIKWHLAHTTWFFETFILKKYLKNYFEFDASFAFLFNSYYESAGERHARPQRGLLTRPAIESVFAYRKHVDDNIKKLAVVIDTEESVFCDLLEVGCHHEMQHQELMLTDLIHAFSLNSLYPAIQEYKKSTVAEEQALEYLPFEEGVFEIGAAAQDGEFAYDCEKPKHKTYLQAFSLGNRCVTNREWLEFMEDGGYEEPLLWLSDGWHSSQKNQWQAPAYWLENDGHWFQFGSAGLQALELDAPVCHVSYYEADAFARWANARLPTEQEWEVACQRELKKGAQISGDENSFSESHLWRARASRNFKPNQLNDLFGNVWEWTQSPYSPYPNFKAEQGALGEYNGKFMANQFVLRGGSCATPALQMRSSYRNFFYPYHRWQFSGLRLAK